MPHVNEIVNKWFVVREDISTGKTWNQPRWARFKMVMRMRGVHGNPSLEYYSLDVETIPIGGKKFYRKNEQEAINGLIQRVKNKKQVWQWYSCSIFINMTGEIDTTKKYFKGDNGGWDLEYARFTPLGSPKTFFNLHFTQIESRQDILRNKGIYNIFLDREDIIRQMREKNGFSQIKINFYTNNLKPTK